MRIKLSTNNGTTYKISRSDGVKFLASRVQFSAISESGPPERDYWAVWPKGHMEARMRIMTLHEALDHVIGGWWPAEGAS